MSSSTMKNDPEESLSSWCLFCYKKVESDHENSRDLERKLLINFSKLSERYLNCNGKKKSVNDLKWEKLSPFLRPCEDCALVIRVLCDFYNEMKCLELKLNWKLETLKAVMISAEKVSSRKKLIQESLSMIGQKQGIDVFATLKIFRRQFVRKASAKMKMSFPRVKLKPCINVVNSSYTEEQKQAATSIAKNNEPPDMEMTEPFLPNNLRELSEEEFEFDSQSISNGVTETSSYDCQLDQLHISENSNRIVTCEIDENVEVEFCPGPSSSSACSIPSILHHNEGNVNDILQEEIEEEETIDLERQFPFSQSEANDGNELDEVVSQNLLEYKEIEPVSSDVNVQANSQISEGDREDAAAASEFIAIKNENIKIEYPKNIRRPRQRNGNIRRKKSRAHIRKHLRELRQSKSKSGQVPSLKECALRKLVKVKYICRIWPCESKVFRNIKDKMRHLKFHENFKCNFCNVSKKYAPHIIEHELNKHNKLLLNKSEKVTNTCPRCDFHGETRGKLIAHHLVSHLKLTPKENRTCPICDLLLDKKSGVVGAFLRHYLTFHDLTKMDPKLAKKCDAPNCTAYFKTSYQLLMHKARVHYVDKQKKFNCMDCGKQFMRIQFLREHRKQMHFTKEKFIVSCTFKGCKKSFECEEDMQRHRKLSHGSGIAKCTICGKFVSKIFMGRHMLSHKKADDWLQNINLSPEICKKFGIHSKRCKIPSCLKLFYNEKDLSTHSKLHGEFKCNHCDEIFPFAKDLALHEMSHQNPDENPSSSTCGSPTFICSRCVFVTSDETEFVSHFLNEHLNLFLDHHTCPICNVQINNRIPRQIRKSLSSHFKIMHEVKSGGNIYNCGYEGCSSYFVTKLQLIAHRNTHKYELKLNNEVKRFECKLCYKMLKSKKSLLLHHNKHINSTSTRAIPCSSDACPRRFETQEELDAHLGDNPVVICEVCGKSFHEFSGLTVHLQVHRRTRNIGKSFDCTTCGKKFKAKEGLRLHELSHSGPDSWEFVCSVCGKKVLTKQKLDEHMRTHSDDKTYFVCDLCGAKYSHRHNLRIHVNSKHGDITKDEPRKFTKTNLTSRKGVKLKSTSGPGASQAKEPVRRGLRNRRKRKLSSTSDYDTDDE